MDMAIKLFSERGYENTKISDITEALRMGKSTFYVYFKNKRELFIECIDRLAVTIVPRESWDEIRNERDYIRKNYKRGTAFLKAFPGYRGILNMIRGAVGRSDPVLAQKAIESFRVLSRPMLKDLRRAVANGTVRIKHDEAFVAYLHLVMAEGFGYWQMIDPRYSVEEGMEIIMDIFQHGLVHTSSSVKSPVDEKGPSGEVEDGTGMKTRLRGHFRRPEVHLAGPDGRRRGGCGPEQARVFEIPRERVRVPGCVDDAGWAGIRDRRGCGDLPGGYGTLRVSSAPVETNRICFFLI